MYLFVTSGRFFLQRINTVAKILEHHHQKGIYPWYNRKRMDHYWRLWLPGSQGGVITINGEEIPLETDCIYIMPCYLQFSSRAEKPFSKFYIHFIPGELFHQQKELFKIPLNTFILQLTEQYKALYDAEPAGSRLCLIAHCVLNWALLQLPPGVLTPSTISDNRIKAVMEKITTHLSQNFSNEELAGQLHLSTNGFLRLFRKECGETPQKFSHRKKLEYAAELLIMTPLSIEEIAEKTGFANRYHFSRQFARQFGRPPALYRNCYHDQKI